MTVDWAPPPGVCPSCWERHRCNICHDAGRVRRQVERTDKRFGVSEPCPVCSGGSHEDAGAPEDTDQRQRIPVAFRDADVSRLSLDQRTAIQSLVSTRPERYLVTLAGAVGSGKTYAAVAALRWRVNVSGERGAFWPVIDLLERYRATFDADRATETTGEIDASLQRTPLLVLDDWGKQKTTEWAEQQLFRLVDERLRNQRRTIVTTNAEPGEFAEALRSRLFGNLALVVRFSGKDRRMS